MAVESLSPLGAAVRRTPLLRGLSAKLSSQMAAAVMAGAFAIAVLVLAAPRFAAQALLLPVHDGLEALRDGRVLSQPALAKIREALARARRFDPGDGRLSTDLALVELLQASSGADGTADKRAWYETAIADLERGLRKSPANSFAWARLAGARLALEGTPGAKMKAALRMSYLTGPFADKIMPFRAALTLSVWDSLDAALKDDGKRELIYLWERRGRWEDNQLPLTKLLCRTGRSGLLAQALIDGHRSTAEFDKLYPYYLSPEACRTKWPSDVPEPRSP